MKECKYAEQTRDVGDIKCLLKSNYMETAYCDGIFEGCSECPSSNDLCDAYGLARMREEIG